MLKLNLPHLLSEISKRELIQVRGVLRSAAGLLFTSTLPAAIGDQCVIEVSPGRRVQAEVIGFRDGVSYLVPFDSTEEISPGVPVRRAGRGFLAPVGEGLLGRVVDGLGRPLDDRGPLQGCLLQPVRRRTPTPLDRSRIRQPFVTGQRAIDGLLTCGQGQRIGIFAGSGVGKSTLLGEIARGSSAAVNVIALIGERGREVRSFLEDCLGEKGMARSVVVVATCEQTPLMRARAAQMAVSMADFYRSRGASVLFLLDSLTRLAMAQRELGLALDEPPSARGYPPSVFQVLAGTVEQLGTGKRGSITGLLTVLVDGDDLDEPVADAVRGLLDGHIVLDRKLAEKGHYPAINIAASISRVAREVTDAGHQQAAHKLRSILATHAEVEDLIRIGAYSRGSSASVDRAVELMPAVLAFLRQQVNEYSRLGATYEAMQKLAAAWPY